MNLLSSFAAQHEPDYFQYNAAIVPFLAVAAIRAASWLLGRCRRQDQSRRLGLGLGILLILSSLGYHRIYGYSPLAAHYEAVSCDRCSTRDRLLLTIPAEASVSAQTTLVPHVSQRTAVYDYPAAADSADFVFLDVTAVHHAIPLTDDYYASIDVVWGQPGVDLVAAEDGYLLFQRGASGPPLERLPAAFYTYALEAAIDEESGRIDFGQIGLVDAELRLARKGWVELTLWWQAHDQVPANYRPAIAVGHQDGDLTAWHRQTLPYRWVERGWHMGEVLNLTTGVSTGHGPAAGWKTGWVLYAGVLDETNGSWLEPTLPDGQPPSNTLRVPIDGQEARLVPVAGLINTWGITRPALTHDTSTLASDAR